MKQIFFIVFAVLFITSCSRSIRLENPDNFIEVNGFAEKKFKPNEFTFSILIDESDRVYGQKVEDLENKMKEILTNLKMDVKKDLKISDMSSDFSYWWMKRKGKIYSSKQYELKINDINIAENAILELEKIGISNISLVKLSHSDIENLKDEVRQEAMKNAQSKAKSLVNSLNQKLGKLLFAQEPTETNYSVRYNQNDEYKDKSIMEVAEDELQLDFQDITISYSILTRFEIK